VVGQEVELAPAPEPLVPLGIDIEPHPPSRNNRQDAKTNDGLIIAIPPNGLEGKDFGNGKTIVHP
jgi:hypothetical protein